MQKRFDGDTAMRRFQERLEILSRGGNLVAKWLLDACGEPETFPVVNNVQRWTREVVDALHECVKEVK